MEGVDVLIIQQGGAQQRLILNLTDLRKQITICSNELRNVRYIVRNRYVFDRDPFSCLDAEADRTDSHDTGGLLDEREYFLHSDKQTLSLKDMRAMSIEPPPFK